MHSQEILVLKVGRFHLSTTERESSDRSPVRHLHPTPFPPFEEKRCCPTQPEQSFRAREERFEMPLQTKHEP